jgi:hypothetical protein
MNTKPPTASSRPDTPNDITQPAASTPPPSAGRDATGSRPAPPADRPAARPRRMPSGAKLGWILSGALVLALAAVVLMFALGGEEPTPPTLAIAKAGFFDYQQVNASPVAFIGALPTGAGDAADDYRQAVEAYRAKAEAIIDAAGNRDQIAEGKYKPSAAAQDAMEKIYAHVAAGAAKKEMRYTTPELIAVRYANEPASQLVRLGEPLLTLAAGHMAASRHEEAEKVLRAMFILGWHMERERVRPGMTLHGMEIEGGAMGPLGDLYSTWQKDRHESQLKAMEEYGRELDRVAADCEHKLTKVLWRLTPNPGDVFATVERDKDRAWRVEALLIVGAIRFTHDKSAGDQKVARSLLEQCSSDADPFVKAAAAASRALTQEGFAQVGMPPQ